jgi:hypothetical protein
MNTEQNASEKGNNTKEETIIVAFTPDTTLKAT